MRVMIDGVEYKDIGHLQSDLMWDEIRKAVENQNHLIHHVLVNGELLSEETNIPYKDVLSVEVYTMSPLALLLDTYQSAIDYLPRLIQGFNQVAEHFRSGTDGEGIKLFLQLENGLDWSLKVFENSMILLPNPAGVQLLFDDYKRILDELLGAWENQDYISVADLLEYELVSCLQEWLQYMENQRKEHSI